MPVPVIIIGNLTIDDVIQADGSSQMGTLGGNSVHATAAALTWVREVGVVARCGADFPAAALTRLREDPVVHVAAMPLAAAAAIVRSVRARAAGAVITLDTHEDWRPGDDVLDASRLVDVFVPSRAELTELTGCDDPERAADGLLAAGVRCVVVKLGGDGALVTRPGSPPAWVPAPPAEVVDPTGAGDSFCGGFAAGLALGDDPVEAAWRGAVTAAAAIGAAGSLRLLDRGGLARDLLAGRPAAPAGATPAAAAPGPVATARPRDAGDYGIETMDREIGTI